MQTRYNFELSYWLRKECLWTNRLLRHWDAFLCCFIRLFYGVAADGVQSRGMAVLSGFEHWTREECPANISTASSLPVRLATHTDGVTWRAELTPVRMLTAVETERGHRKLSGVEFIACTPQWKVTNYTQVACNLIIKNITEWGSNFLIMPAFACDLRATERCLTFIVCIR